MKPELVSEARPEKSVTMSSRISGFRSNGVKDFLYQTALNCGLDLKITDEDKGWFRHTIYFSLTGPEETVQACFDAMGEIVNAD